jgi:hypothetical protein
MNEGFFGSFVQKRTEALLFEKRSKNLHSFPADMARPTRVSLSRYHRS